MGTPQFTPAKGIADRIITIVVCLIMMAFLAAPAILVWTWNPSGVWMSLAKWFAWELTMVLLIGFFGYFLSAFCPTDLVDRFLEKYLRRLVLYSVVAVVGGSITLVVIELV